ncbi:A-kinase anchor protein 8-like isoform X2 [Dendropsophus ebraccatus]|uniref:A-kinase anchor protein 8-like isoform X2 n=1 Tax=Dendropsophus ebraccatus TaxID=150705 RepID=UPI0038311B92
MRVSIIGSTGGAMAAGRGGAPRFPYPRFPGNGPPFYMGALRPPRFPTYNRLSMQNDFVFTENNELQGSSFWVGPFDTRDSTPAPVLTKKERKKTNKAAAPSEAPPPAAMSKKALKRAKKAAANNPQQPAPAAASQPQSSGDAAKSPQQPATKANTSQPASSGGAAKSPQKPVTKAVSPPQSSGGAASNPQKPATKAASQPPRSGVTEVSTAKNPQQPNQPGVSQPANSAVNHKQQTTAQNGDLKRSREAGEATGANVPTPPHKKLKAQKEDQPAERPELGWRGDTRFMFSCSLCRYLTHDEHTIQNHLNSFQHKEILKHLCIFFPRERVEFLHKYLLFRKKLMSTERKNSNLQTMNDYFKGIGTEHDIHRVLAAHCQTCDVIMPDDYHHVTMHIRSEAHSRNRKAAFKDTKSKSIMAAKNLLVDKDVVNRLKQLHKGLDPFKDKEIYSSPVHSPEASNPDEVLVAEEDDDEDGDESFDGFNDGDGEEVPSDWNEDPVHENKDLDVKVSPPIEEVRPDHQTEETSSIAIPTEVTVREEQIEEEEEEEEAAEAP